MTIAEFTKDIWRIGQSEANQAWEQENVGRRARLGSRALWQAKATCEERGKKREEYYQI
jgi:hypothetical protein